MICSMLKSEGDYVKLRKSIVNDIQNHVYKHTESGTDLERLSSIHIPAAIFSAIHWDKRRKLLKFRSSFEHKSTRFTSALAANLNCQAAVPEQRTA